jgi:transposase
MRKIREVLRLKFDRHLSDREIAQSCAIARSTVGEYLRRYEQTQLGWPLPETLDDAQLEQLVFPPLPAINRHERPQPDWAAVHQALRRQGVTLFLLWQEHKAAHPNGYQYSQFCHHYQRFVAQLEPVMRQRHRPGEKLFVDYAGQTVEILDRHRGERTQAQLFVAVLGASNYTYLEASASQTLPDWIMSHVRAVRFFGGAPALIVPDNLKAGVARACRYDPDINPTYAAMAAYYGVAVMPARAAKPRDKAKVEVAVQIAERWVLARLRHQTFFSLEELNGEIARLRAELNTRPFQKLPGNRQSAFEQLDRPALAPLPPTPYVYTQWLKARVSIDYHISVEGSYYSVPYQLIGNQLDVALSAHTVEVFARRHRVASHRRAPQPGTFVTVTEHLPRAHQTHAEWTPQRLIQWAPKTGPATAELIDTVLRARAHVQQGFRACLGIVRLGQSYGDQRLEAAARRALVLGTTRYHSIESILKNGLDQQPLPALDEHPTEPLPAAHANIRGADYYH